MHHLRNIWIKGAVKVVSGFLHTFLADSLNETSSFLRVSPHLSQIIRAYHKEFSPCCNYPKGHGELFLDWVKNNYPNEFSMHAEHASGSRMDLI